MKFVAFATAASVAVTVACVSTTVAAKDTMVGRWKIQSNTGSDGSPFCAMRVGDDDNGFGIQVTSAGSLYLGISNSAWKFTPKQTVNTKYVIDGKPTWEGTATAVAPGFLANGLQTSSDPVSVLAVAKSVSVSPEGGATATFDLSGAKEAADAMRTCTAAFPASKQATAPAPTAPEAAKTTVGDWDIAPVEGTPGECIMARGYVDKEDDNAANAITIKKMPSAYAIALTYFKWNWSAGEKTKAPFVTSDGVLNDDAQWVADKTGKVLVTTLPLDKEDALSTAEQLMIKFPDGDATFEVPKIGDALKALTACAETK